MFRIGRGAEQKAGKETEGKAKKDAAEKVTASEWLWAAEEKRREEVAQKAAEDNLRDEAEAWAKKEAQEKAEAEAVAVAVAEAVLTPRSRAEHCRGSLVNEWRRAAKPRGAGQIRPREPRDPHFETSLPKECCNSLVAGFRRPWKGIKPNVIILKIVWC